MNNQGLVIADTHIKQDEEGRYCLNDFHKASGCEQKHRPKYWLESSQTNELIALLEQELTEGGFPPSIEKQPVKVIKGGIKQGTYVVKELVYAYAMWISAKFHLHVIRAYDALVTQPVITLANLPRIERNPHLAVRKAVLKLAAIRDVPHQTVYHRLYDRFQVESYKDIPVEYCLAAIEYVRALEGEYLPKQEKPKSDLANDLNLELICHYTPMLYEIVSKIVYPALRTLDARVAGSLFGYSQELMVNVNILKRRIEVRK